MNDIRKKAIEFENKMYGVATNQFVDGFVNGYEQGKADAINPIQKFIDDYDGAIIISENMGVISGQQLINELKEIVEQLKGAEE